MNDTEIGILKFDLTDPDAAEHFRVASKARSYVMALWDFDQWLRLIVRGKCELPTKDSCEAFNMCRDRLREIMDDNGVSTEDLS